MIDPYKWGTHNGPKVSITLDASDTPYQVHRIDIT
jgi:glutathione S-transferase